MGKGHTGIESVGNGVAPHADESAVAAVAPRGRTLEPSFSKQPTIPDEPTIHGKPPVLRPSVPHSSNVELFRRAVVALLEDAPGSEAARQHSTEAASALFAGAVAGDAGLAQILRPDPDDAGPVTWTVACYQIGDLSPSTLRDFTDVNDAVQAVAHCPEPAHVAAELLASSASGLRWPAMVRTGEMLHFQLPGTSAGGEPGVGGVLDAAPHRWVDRLASSTAPAPAAIPPELGVLLVQILDAVQGLARGVEDLASGRDVRERLYTLEQRVVEAQLRLEVSSVPLAPGSRDLELTRTTVDLPVARPWRPGDRVGPGAASSDRPAAPERPRLERLLGTVGRLSARGRDAARRERAWWSGVAARAVSTRSPEHRAGVEPGSDGPASRGPALPGPGPTTYSMGWCTDDPCRE
jgi:hypothetical protein